MSIVTINTTLAKEAWFVAQTQLDITEQSGNKGPEVKRYLKSVGLPEGNSWCMAFVYWCVDMAAKKLGLTNPLVNTGGVLRQYNETTCRTIPAVSLLSMNIDEPFIFIIDHGGGLGHAGFGMMKTKAIGIATTIEGNSNETHSREGTEVCSNDRSITEFKGIILLP